MKIELTDKDRAIINDLVSMAWQAGFVKSPAQANEVEAVRHKIIAKEEPKE